MIGGHRNDANLMAREIVELETKPRSEDTDAAEDKMDIEARRGDLTKVKKDIGKLETFYKEINSQWSDLACQNIGHVNWAPAISVDIEGRHYTKDIGTFKVDTVRFRIQFKGNIVNLGAFCLIFLVVTLSN